MIGHPQNGVWQGLWPYSSQLSTGEVYRDWFPGEDWPALGSDHLITWDVKRTWLMDHLPRSQLLTIELLTLSTQP